MFHQTSTPKLSLIKRGNGVFYISITDPHTGKRWFKSTRQRTKSEASQFLREFKVDSQPEPAVLTFSQLAKKFIDLKRGEIRPTSMKSSYEPTMKIFLRMVGDKAIMEYTPLDIQEFVQKRLQDVSRHTVNIHLRCLKSMANWAVRLEILSEKNPLSKVRLLKVPEKPIEYLTPDQFTMVYEAEHEQSYKDIYLFAVLSGLRLGAILNMRWEHVDFERQLVTISNDDGFTTKSGKNQTLPLHPKLVEMLTQRKQRNSGCPHVFYKTKGAFPTKYHVSYVSHRFKKVCRKVGLSEAIHFHCLRKSFGSWLVQKGISLFEVSKLMGHSSILITQRNYAHLATAELHESVSKLTL